MATVNHRAYCLDLMVSFLYGSHLLAYLISCREKSRISLSIKQVEEDPFLENSENVIPQVRNFA